MSEKFLIINGDDAGIDHQRNEGLIKSFEEGVLTSVTALVNGPAFEEIAHYTAKHPGLGIGIHLNLTQGRALSGRLKTLTDEEGNFHPKARAWANAWQGKLDEEEISKELMTQLEAFAETGLTPTHLDGHNHIHLFPQVLQAILALMDKSRVMRRLRLVNEGPPFYGPNRAKDALPDIEMGKASEEVQLLYRLGHQKVGFFRHLSDLARPKVKGRIRHPDEFHGIHLAANFTQANFESVVANLKTRVTEIMTHPGFRSANSVRFSRSRDREREYLVLTDRHLKEKIEASGLTLANYLILKAQ